jgi:NADH-quinone oxidoreductase subunit M
MLTGLLIFWPLLASVIVLCAGSAHAKKLAFGASLVELAIAIASVAQFNPAAGTQFKLDFWWIESLGISFKVGIDGISMILVLLTTVLVPFIIASSFNKLYEKPALFYSLVLLMQMALVGVFVSLDAFLFYIFWELALIPIYFICLLWGGENRGAITFKFFVYTLAGSLLMLVGLILVYINTPGVHTFDMAAMYKAGRSLSMHHQHIVFWLIFLAFAIKMPVFPLHTWQPDTYTVAPAPGTMLLSGIMLKMGIFGVLRWLLPLVPAAFSHWSTLVIVLSVIGIVYASCIAIVQKDFKRLIAYSSIAHVGLIAAGCFAGNVQALQGVMIQMISHGINVIALFYIVDIIQARTGTRMIHELGGIRHNAPVFTTVFVIVMLGTVALPLTNGFIGEFLLLTGLYQYSHVAAGFAGLTIILGAVYMLRSFQTSMLNLPSLATRNFVDLTGQEKLVLIPLAALVILIGVYPKPLLDISEPAIKDLLSNISTGLK